MDVRIVALASSRYFANAEEYGWPGTLDVFDGRVTWAQIAEKYPDKLLDQADSMYKRKPVNIGGTSRYLTNMSKFEDIMSKIVKR